MLDRSETERANRYNRARYSETYLVDSHRPVRIWLLNSRQVGTINRSAFRGYPPRSLLFAGATLVHQRDNTGGIRAAAKNALRRMAILAKAIPRIVVGKHTPKRLMARLRLLPEMTLGFSVLSGSPYARVAYEEADFSALGIG